MKVTFIGAGRWAITLALVLYRKDNEIRMWEYSKERLKNILDKRTTPDLPSSIQIPKNIAISDDLEKSLESAEIIFFAVPSQILREVLIKISPFRFIVDQNIISKRRPILVSAIKGLENNTNKRMSEIIKEIFPNSRIVVLAGPGIPIEISAGKPASLVAASHDMIAAVEIQKILSFENLRVYTHADVVGVELGGALKNVMAIAGGICDGLELGDNAKAALLTRGLAEITRLGIAFNSNPMTFAGLSGMGDLIVTAYSPYSRNRICGELLGKGDDLEKITKSLTGVAEGIATTVSAKGMASKIRLELPIIDEIQSILFKGSNITKSIRRLMERPLKME